MKSNCQCFVREESNPYTSCQGAELKEGSISHKAGSLDHMPEGFGIDLQNIYRKKKPTMSQKTKPSKTTTLQGRKIKGH